jgi:hypothetical protein
MTSRLLLAALVLASGAPPALAECDLGELIGYQVMFGKVIDSYIEDGERHHGFAGCATDRMLVFADNTGLRCKETFVQHADRPRGYLFARNAGDLKLCVDGTLYRVGPPN